MPTIQPSSEEDIPELLALVHSAYRGEGSKIGWTTEADILDGTRISEATMKRYIEKKNAVFLKYQESSQSPEEEDQILGCVFLEKVVKKDELKCYLGLLTVSPHFQSKGIGKQLLQFANEWARNQGCASLYMSVISCRHELIKFYKKYGFIETGEKEPFHTEPEFGIPKQELEFIGLEKRFE